MNQRIHVITKHEHGTVSIENPDPELMMLRTLKIGLNLEIKTEGRMRLTRGPMASTRARQLGYKGNREKQIAQIESRIILRCMEIQAHNASIPE